jgi:hypothetical protein
MKKLLAAASAFALLAVPALAMTNPGIVTLGDFQIGAAGQQSTPAAQIPTNLQGLTALSCQARFMYGSGGTKVNVYIQSSLDQGQTWFDIANIAFTTASGIEEVNLSGLNSLTTPTAPSYLSLADNTTFNGPLGDRLQAVVVSTGTYAGGTLASVRCSTR